MTTYTPLENPDLSGLDPSTIGVDSNTNSQSINSQLSPFSLDSNNTLNISKVVNFASDITISGIITNTNLENKLSLLAHASYVDNTFATQAALDLKADKTTVYTMTEIDNSLGLKANLANPTFTGTVSGITKAMVGLGNADNTSDASKPVSTATQASLDLKANLASPSFTGTPTIGTNPIAVKPWVSGRFGGVSSGNPNITGTASNTGTGSGTQSFTVTRQQTGTYNITWTTGHPSGGFYTVLVSVRGAFTCSYGIPTSTSFQIYTYGVGTTTLADPTAGDISFMVLQ